MALNGTISNTYKGWTLRVEWSATQSVTDNTSTITCVHKLVCASGYDLYVSGRSNRCYVDGTPVYYSSPSISTAGNQTITLGTTKHTVQHNDNGTKSCQVTSYFYVRATLSGTYKEYFEARATITLDTIARASQPSLITYPENTQDVGYFGDTISIHMNRKSSDFTHKVRYAFGSLSGTCVDYDTGKAATAVETGFKWTIPLSFMDQIPNSTSGSGTIYVDTYNGSTLVGTKYSGFTAKVPSSVKPSCSCTWKDITGIKDTYGSPVQGLSKINVTTSATKAYGSPIKSYSISIDGVKYSTNDVTTGFLVNAGTSKVTVTVTDTRGRSGSCSSDMSVLEYTPPSVSKLAVHRCDASGNEDDQGEYVKVTISATVTSMSNKNTASYVLKHKKTSETEYTSITLSGLNNNYAPTDYSYVLAADGNSSHNIAVTVTDKHGSVARSTSVSTAFTMINFHPSGTGVRYGGVAQEENTLQNDLWLVQTANRYCFSSIGSATTDGYILMAQIEITATNSDSPITFVFGRRKATAPMTVHVCFEDTADLTPGLQSISYEGENYGAFLVPYGGIVYDDDNKIKGATVWNLYVQKENQSDTVTLNDWFTSYRQMKRVSVTFPGTIVEGNEPNVLGTYHRATPAKLQSLLDFIYPVGSIYISYSHVSPASMFGGTWTRINNAFLWATSSTGEIGQTGGESTHALTVNEMPSHKHTIRWNDANNPAVSLSNSNASGSGTSGSGYILSYTKGTVYTDSLVAGNVGGGAAHNNMPPYIQVSVWRRTG